MADIAQLLSNAADTKADFNFGKITDAYWAGLENTYKQKARNVFEDPSLYGPDGQIDTNKATKALFGLGVPGIEAADKLADVGLKQSQAASGNYWRTHGFDDPSGFPPSINPTRNANTPVAENLTQGRRSSAQPGGQPQADIAPPSGQPTVMMAVSGYGVPNDQLPQVSAYVARQLKSNNVQVGPNGEVNLNDPATKGILDKSIAMLNDRGMGQSYPQGQPVPGPQVIPPVNPQVAQASPQAPPQAPPQTLSQVPAGTPGDFAQRFQPNSQPPVLGPGMAAPPQVAQAAPPQSPTDVSAQRAAPSPPPLTTPLTSTMPNDVRSRAEQAVNFYTRMLRDPNLPATDRAMATGQLQHYQKMLEPSEKMKDYADAVASGDARGMTRGEWEIKNAGDKVNAEKMAESYAKKYESIVANGDKAESEIPQLKMLQGQMNDPNFFSGQGEKYNLMFKRLKAAVGIDPNAAVPQEMMRKVIASNVMAGLGAFKGLGAIRNPEIRLAETANAAPENSIPANKLLIEMAVRTHQINSDIAGKAQKYVEDNGRLDAGFDKQVRQYYQTHPMFSDAEIKNWHKVIGEDRPASTNAQGQQKFASPSDVRAAVSAGKLKKGDTFIDANGTPRLVP